MKIFIDTSIPSDFLKGNITSKNESHLESILLSFQAKKIKIITLESTKEKINRIPELNLSQNNKLLLLLKDIDAVEEFGYCGGLRPGSIGGYEVFDEIFETLINTVDNLEARQVYQAIKHKCDFFLTSNKNILKKATKINKLNIQVSTPELMSIEIVNSNLGKKY